MAAGLNVVEGGRRYGGLEKLVFVGTKCSYPKLAPIPFTEDNIWSGYPEETNAPYGVAKRALLSMCGSYREQYDMNIVYLVLANLYGPHDHFDVESSHVIPALIRKFTAAQRNRDPEVVAWGTGSPSREFLYVEDAAEGIVLAAERYDGAEPVNLGTGQEVKIRELLTMIATLVGYEGRIVWDTTKPDGQPRRHLDVSRARDRFGFEFQTDLEEGLRNNISWYTGDDGIAV
jgi:GDP-L-fucose synthase